MICDYWLIRHRRLHVPMLYQNDGIYHYSCGINWRALVTLLVVVPVNLPGLIHAIDSSIKIGDYSYFYRASWLTATLTSGAIYLILCLLVPPYKTLLVEDVAGDSVDTGLNDSQVEKRLAVGDKY